MAVLYNCRDKSQSRLADKLTSYPSAIQRAWVIKKNWDLGVEVDKKGGRSELPPHTAPDYTVFYAPRPYTTPQILINGGRVEKPYRDPTTSLPG